MPIRRNSSFNDPAFAQAAENLSTLFAPPSGSEAAGWAAANAKNAEAKRLADFYALSQDETVDRNRLDRAGIGSGSYAPASSYYAVDQTQETSRSNNTADNARALEDRRLQEAGSLQRKYAEPITVAKDANVYLPGDTAAATGLPRMLSGMYSASPGERLTLPDGRVIDGQAKPLSQDEFMAQQQQDLRAKGQLTDEDILNAVRGKETPVQAVSPDGRPVYMNPGAAVTSNAEPYIKDTTVQTDNYRDPTGKVGTAFYDEREKVWKDTQNKQPLPDGSITSSKVPTDAIGSGFGKPTEASDKAGMFYNRAAPASSNLDTALQNGYVPADLDYEFSLGALSGSPNALANRAVSDEGRKFYNNATNFMMAVLRPDTGAAFGKDEFQSYAKVFVPLPGDDEATIKEKSIARATALSALQGTSRGSAEQIAAILQQNGLPIPKEMAAVIARGGIKSGQPQAAPAPPPSPDSAPAPLTGETERWDFVNGKLQRVQ